MLDLSVVCLYYLFYSGELSWTSALISPILSYQVGVHTVKKVMPAFTVEDMSER